MGSDHYPIFIRSNIPLPGEKAAQWKLNKADWATFKQLCEEEIHPEMFEDGDDPIALFTDHLCEIAERTIPKSSTKPKKRNKPWYNDECRDALKARRDALKTLERHPTLQNMDRHRIRRANARRVIRTNKKRSWHDYVSTLNSKAPIKKTCDMIRKISGKGVGQHVSHLETDGEDITEYKDISNTLGQSFANNSFFRKLYSKISTSQK